jgi:hypothetical protein
MIGGTACLLAVVTFATKLALIRQTSHSFEKNIKDAEMSR